MGNNLDRTQRIEALRGLTERLSAPDLTLAESKVLRDLLSDLLESGDRRGGWNPSALSPTGVAAGRGEGYRQEVGSPEAAMRAAG